MLEVNLTNAGNVQVPAYLVLQSKGYIGSRESSKVTEPWRATGPARGFAADDPVSLLGLAALADVRGAHWKATDTEIEEFLVKFERPDIAAGQIN